MHEGFKKFKKGGNNMNISFAVNTSRTTETMNVNKKSTKLQKPVWNPNKIYKYLEDMNKGFQDYKAQATAYYRAEIGENENSVMTTEELKKQINELFPEYTLTSTEPSNVTQGKYYLYIDASNLEKMAKDADYRARVYGLMDSELQGSKGYTLQYSDGRNVTTHLTGSIFSLSDANRKYDCGDGIPYRGSCTSDQGFSTTDSHPQVRNMSFIYDNLDPAKSAARARRTLASQNAARLAKKQEKKLLAKKSADKITQKKAADKKATDKKVSDKKDSNKKLEKMRLEKEQIEEQFDEKDLYGVIEPSEQYGSLGKQNTGKIFDRNA